MTPDQTNDPAVIRNSWDDDEPAKIIPEIVALAERVKARARAAWGDRDPDPGQLRAVLESLPDTVEAAESELAVLREKVARVEALTENVKHFVAVETLRAALADPAPVVHHDDATDGEGA